jgi:CheY-like chemotaxis protein
MSSSLIVLTGPPLPGRWSLARNLERRCDAVRFVVDAVNVPLIDIARSVRDDVGCVLVDGDLPTADVRREVLELAEGVDRVLVEWSCSRAEAEREVFHRYASRPPVLASAEFERYLDDARVRQPVRGELADGRVVRLSPCAPIDEQVERVVDKLMVPPVPRAPGGERRVMIVEDDADERAMLGEVLGELGFGVEMAPDAGVALALLADGVDVELMISDHLMPGMSGVELSREVAVRHPSVRTVLLTAYGDETLARNALAAHAVTVLAKPLRMVDLERVLDETGTL